MGSKASTQAEEVPQPTRNHRARTYSTSDTSTSANSGTSLELRHNNDEHSFHHSRHYNDINGVNGPGSTSINAISVPGGVRARSYSSSIVQSGHNYASPGSSGGYLSASASTSAAPGFFEFTGRISSFTPGVWPMSGVKCPICCKQVLPDDIEVHLVMCLTRPRINYNEDRLTESKNEECVICLEDLDAGEVIARLPCLCIYHKVCIDKWFQVNRSCPEHPNN